MASVKGLKMALTRTRVRSRCAQSDIKPAAIDEEDMLEGQTEIGGVNAQTFKRLANRTKASANFRGCQAA